jgi:hypothetical protein
MKRTLLMQIINKNKLRHGFVKWIREIKNLSDKKTRVMIYKTKQTNYYFFFQKCLNSADELGSIKNGGGCGGCAFPAPAAIIANCKSRSRACCSSIKR